jgi:nicotinamide-nucleotide amidase
VATAGAVTYRQEMLRLFGIPESEIAATLRAAEDERGIPLSELEITTCLRRGEVEVVTRFAPAAADVYAALAELIGRRHGDTLFSDDGRSVDEQVAALLVERALTIAVAESCTGGLVAARLTELPGSSRYMLGGVVAYADAAKIGLVGVPADLIERFGAVSTEVAEALADGTRARLGADVGVGVTGVAGPEGGTEEKPVGLVCFSVSAEVDGEVVRLTRRIQLPGSRADVRDRSTTVAMHLVRRLLLGETDAFAGFEERGGGAARAAGVERS